MNNFQYAEPKTEAEVLEMLSPQPDQTVLLAGGTDLVGMLKKMTIQPSRVVNIREVDSLHGMHYDSFGRLWIGAALTLDEFLRSSLSDAYPAPKQVIQQIGSLQLQAQGTLVGELLRRPACWYFRNGHDLLAESGRLVVEGDNRYHAILGNRGPAKFVNASRLAPALIALGASARIVGPDQKSENLVPLERLYQTPRNPNERENTLLPNQFVSHIILPADDGKLSAAYEVRHGQGPYMPLAAASAAMQVVDGVVRAARVVLGQVAPIPWVSGAAESVLVGNRLSESLATTAGEAAVVDAMPLSQNEYKIQLAKVAVKRTILRATGTDCGGF